MKRLAFIVGLFMVINSITICSHQVNNEKKKCQSNLQSQVDLHVRIPDTITIGEKIIIWLEITNKGDKSVVLFKDAAIILTRLTNLEVFGESVQFLNGFDHESKGKPIFKERIAILPGETYTYQLQPIIEPPLFRNGFIDDLMIQYYVARSDEIDFLECSLDTILVL